MELLKKLYCIDAKSGSEKDQRDFIVDFVKNNVKDAAVSIDKKGNLYVIKGKSETYPCIVSHLDEVHDKRGKNFTIIESNGFIMGMNIDTRERHGIGADDKNGIWVCLRCLEKFDAMKCAFFVQEEVGCCGSGSADMTFFENCRFVIQCDRKGNSDFITNASGADLCNKRFETDAKFKDFGYSRASGLMTDVYKLRVKGLELSCCNISCGYYEPHTKSEYTYFPDLENCLALVESIVTNCTDVYEFKKKVFIQRSFDDYLNYGYGETWSQRAKRLCMEWLKKQTDNTDITSAWLKYRKYNSSAEFEIFTDMWILYEEETKTRQSKAV